MGLLGYDELMWRMGQGRRSQIKGGVKVRRQKIYRIYLGILNKFVVRVVECCNMREKI